MDPDFLAKVEALKGEFWGWMVTSPTGPLFACGGKFVPQMEDAIRSRSIPQLPKVEDVLAGHYPLITETIMNATLPVTRPFEGCTDITFVLDRNNGPVLGCRIMDSENVVLNVGEQR